MSFHYRKEVISPEVLQELYSLTPEQKAQKEIRDAQIRAIITGESDKFLLIIGPCSADHEDSVCEYITRLAKMQEKVEEKILIVPRIYTNKPRTTGEGYKGIVHQPDPEKAPDFMEGLIAMRKMHLRAISETGLFSADEMLYPENWPYISDILSYVAVGARSVEDQQHRMTVSGMDVPAGMKNPTSGDFSRYVKFLYCGPVLTYFPVSWTRGNNRRKSIGTHYSSRCRKQTWTEYSKLSL